MDERVLKEFLRWGAAHQGFQYGSIAYWVQKYIEEKGA